MVHIWLIDHFGRPIWRHHSVASGWHFSLWTMQSRPKCKLCPVRRYWTRLDLAARFVFRFRMVSWSLCFLRQWSYSSALCCSRWPCWSTPGTDEARSGRSRKHHKLIQFWYDSVTKDMCKVTRCCVFKCFEYRFPSVVRICQDDWGTAGPMQLRTCLLWTMRAERWRTTRPRRTSMLEEAMSVNVRDARKDENVQTIAGMWWLCMIDMSIWHGMTWHMRCRWRATLLRFAFCWMRSCRQSQTSQAERWCMRPGWLWLGICGLLVLKGVVEYCGCFFDFFDLWMLKLSEIVC